MVGSQPGRYREIRRVTLVGSAVDLVLGVVKLWIGWLAQSQALVADGIHSLSDLITDFLVLFASQQASREADDEHPYGHGRIETAATVLLGASLIVVAVGIALDAVRRLFQPELLWQPQAAALLVAAVSVVAKEAIYRYTARAARRLRSDLLQANAWHSRTDALSSIFVMIGVVGALAGLDYIDAIAAIAVAVMIARIGARLSWRSLRELIDTGLEQARLDAIESSILSVDGVAALHMLRTRRMAGQALVDVHILLKNPRMSVSEGHQISETVRARLIDTIDEVADVMVHIDPEDDELWTPTRTLPLRDEVLARLDACWRGLTGADQIEEIRLHYLEGRIQIELVVPMTLAGAGGKVLEQRLREAIATDPDLSDLRLLYE